MTRPLALLALCLAIAAPSALAGGDADGAALYKSKCAICHGQDGAGQTPVGKSLKARDLRSAEVQKQSDAELAKWIAEGKGTMPAFKSSLSAGDIEALVAFLRTLKK